MVECPYCGIRMQYYDIDEEMGGLSGEMQCRNCERKLRVVARKEVAYDVFPVMGE